MTKLINYYENRTFAHVDSGIKYLFDISRLLIHLPMSFFNFIKPEDLMLPCLNKQLFGIECLGCGIQRATLFLFQGEFFLAFKTYPAIYTLFLLTLFLIFNIFVKFKYAYQIKILLIAINVLIVVVSYFIKMSNYY